MASAQIGSKGALPIAVASALLCAACGSATASGKGQETAESTHYYSKLFGFRADGGDYNASTLAREESQLEGHGLSANEAREVMLNLISAGVASGRMQDFELSSLGMSKLFDVAPAESAKEVGQAFTQGYNEIAALDDRLNFLTADQRVQIRDLFDAGKDAEGRTRAFEIFKAKSTLGLQL